MIDFLAPLHIHMIRITTDYILVVIEKHAGNTTRGRNFILNFSHIYSTKITHLLLQLCITQVSLSSLLEPTRFYIIIAWTSKLIADAVFSSFRFERFFEV